jgi:hypothetical protein
VDRHKPVDWAQLAQEFQRHTADLIHREGAQLSGTEFYAEALRRTFGYATNDGADGRRELPYDTVRTSTGLTTLAEADHLRSACTAVDRVNREAAERRAREAQGEARSVLREAAQRVADHIRARCNDRSVPSRLRRDGVLLAADWVDPRVPKDRFGNVLRPTEATTTNGE